VGYVRVKEHVEGTMGKRVKWFSLSCLLARLAYNRFIIDLTIMKVYLLLLWLYFFKFILFIKLTESTGGNVEKEEDKRDIFGSSLQVMKA
jgi:hypothetical protein